jgi:uncharacterized membrane protein
MASQSAIVDSPSLSIQASNQRGHRLDAIDMLRGLVIMIMAIDHVRDFFLFGTEQDPMANPNITAGLFATRWITHFCAPVFVLLAGVSAGLMSRRRSRIELARFLFTRGLWLVVAEMLIVSTITSFTIGGSPQTGGRICFSMQVIFAIGISMVVLSAAQWLGRRSCFAIGLAIIAGHNLLDAVWPTSRLSDQQWPIWVALHSQMSFVAGPFLFRFVYPPLAWIGVMALGFGVSEMFELPPARRNVILRRAGVILITAFILIRAIGIYGDANPWQVQPAGIPATVMDFLNTTKYPPSLDYLLMTLGPAALLCSYFDRVTGAIKSVLATFGRVPFAFYMAHFFLIHLFSVLLGMAQGFSAGDMMTAYRFYPRGYGVGLPWVYAVWALVVALLFPLCRWMAGVKARRRDWWLSYV